MGDYVKKTPDMSDQGGLFEEPVERTKLLIDSHHAEIDSFIKELAV